MHPSCQVLGAAPVDGRRLHFLHSFCLKKVELIFSFDICVFETLQDVQLKIATSARCAAKNYDQNPFLPL